MHAVIANLLHSRATRVLIVTPPSRDNGGGAPDYCHMQSPEPFDDYEGLEVWPNEAYAGGGKRLIPWRTSTVSTQTPAPPSSSPAPAIVNGSSSSGSKSPTKSIVEAGGQAQAQSTRSTMTRSGSAASLREVGAAGAAAAGAAARGMAAWWSRLLQTARSRASGGERP